MADIFLRILDAGLGFLWLYFLVVSLAARRIGGPRGFLWSRNDRRSSYWWIIALLVLMVVHFFGLAIMGQFRQT
jgi:hypothetical protein